MKKTTIYLIVFLVILIMISCLSLTIGSYSLSLTEIIDIILGKNQSLIQQKVFYTLRMPRVVMALLVGSSLGMVGAIYQVIFSNPLASPDLTGVASGCSLGAAVAIILHMTHPLSLTLGAFVMGMVTLFIVVGLMKLTGSSKTSSLILAGIIVSSLADAGLMILKYIADPYGELAAIEFWTMGSLASMTQDKMIIALLMAFIPFVLLCLFHRQVTLLSLGDDQAQFLGLNAKAFRLFILILTTWLVASVISVTGVISFVGLIAPHIVYLMIKKRTGLFFIMSGMMGAFITVIADLLARTLVTYAELPISILTILISIPLLIYWMYRHRGKIL